ncbi:MAG TPA: thioredoxin domain-containing protein [Solirubrobacteraceae bacterium]|nr:thioredoxin domain-containing protein [Solirubrobacteraceae bacterium]
MSRPAHLLNEDHALTRKQRRERARAERKALERAAVAGAARRTRMTQLAIVVSVVAAGIVAILIATAGSATVKKIAPETAAARSVDSGVATLLAGLPQNGNVLGRPTAPVTLEYFGDLECPVCRSFTVNALRPIIGKWVRGGQLRIEYHSLETATREPEVFKSQQVAALAAGQQQKMWNFIETFYHEQGEEDSGYVTEGYIQGIAKQVPGLNLTQWTSERNDPTLADQVESDAQAANAAGFNGTPAFLIGRSGGAMTKLEPSSFSQAAPFDEAIAKLAKS